MLHRVYEAARGCKLLRKLWVATDSGQIREYCRAHKIPVLMTARTHQNGTERLHEVMQKKPGDVFLCIQGDEPMLQPSHLDLLIEPFLRRRKTQVSTLKTRLAPEEADNPNVVKVVTNAAGRALYFSRAAIPFHRNPASPLPFYKHLGLYAYSRQALAAYMRLPVSLLEQTERLEQIRFIENGIPIEVAESPVDTIGVDTEEDLQAVTRYFEKLAFSR